MTERNLTNTMFRCSWCGELFPAKRDDAKFCKPAHRAKYWRWRKRLDSAYKKLGIQLDEIGKYLEHDHSKAAAAEAIVKVKARCDELLRLNNIRVVR